MQTSITKLVRVLRGRCFGLVVGRVGGSLCDGYDSPPYHSVALAFECNVAGSVDIASIDRMCQMQTEYCVSWYSGVP